MQKLIDNNRLTLLETIKNLAPDFDEISIATGYWDLHSIDLLLEELKDLKKIRLLIGKEPLIPRYGQNQIEEDFPEEDIKYDLAQLEQSTKNKELIKIIKKWINEEKKLEVKILKNNFLHAKAYIFGNLNSEKAVGIVGSSNFTGNGLNKNRELNYVEDNQMIIQFQPQTSSQPFGHLSWFDDIWHNVDAVDWNQEFQEILGNSPVGDTLYSPYETYIKTIYEIFKNDLVDIDKLEDDIEESRPRFRFQRENAYLLIQKLKRNKTAMLSDSVGLGKTITSLTVVKELRRNKRDLRTEIICPASLVEHWKKEIKKEKIFNTEVTSKSNLGEIEKKISKNESIDLFIIDESHNLKNLNAKSSDRIMEYIQNNPQALTLLVTATPISNQLTDLRNQLLIGTAGNVDSFYINYINDNGTSEYLDWKQYIDRIQRWVVKEQEEKGYFDPDELNFKITPIIRQFVVRRTRQGIKKRYGNLKIDNREMLFPEVSTANLEYEYAKIEENPNEKINDLNLKWYFSKDPEDLIDNFKFYLKHPIDILETHGEKIKDIEYEDNSLLNCFYLIFLLGLTPYKWKIYKKELYGKNRKEALSLINDDEEKRKTSMQISFFGIFRSILLKRLESSIYAFELSLRRYIELLKIFNSFIDLNKFPTTKAMDELIKFSEEDLEEIEEYTLEKLKAESKKIDSKLFHTFEPKDYEIELIKQDIQRDILICEEILSKTTVIKKDTPKLNVLQQKLEEIKKNDPKAKVLIFTYFKDTLDYLNENITSNSKIITSNNSEFISSTSTKERESILDRFAPNVRGVREELKKEEEIDFLFSTDTLSEGQNLQDASTIINFDLHWSPVRMIQRNGRINRLGSNFKEVYVYNFKPEGSLESFLKLIRRLEYKINIISNTIGTDVPILDEEENPIEFVDKLDALYSQDENKRKEALDELEYELDYLTPDDKFIDDLEEFKEVNKDNEEYINEVFNISNKKWGLYEKAESREAYSLVKLHSSESEEDSIFNIYNVQNNEIVEYPQISFLSDLREASYDNKNRVTDNITLDKNEILKLIFERVEKIEIGKKMKRRLEPKDKKFLTLVMPLVPKIDFQHLRDSLESNNEIMKKKIKKYRDTILSGLDEANSELVEEQLNGMISYFLKAAENDTKKNIKFDKSTIILNFSSNE